MTFTPPGGPGPRHLARRLALRAPRTGLSSLAITAAVAVLLSAGAGAAQAQAPSAVVLPGLSLSVPSGKLTPGGACQETAAAASCDLYAMAGTSPILGSPIDIWGFSSTGTAGTATAPGPVLVVNQGDTVTITLHNQLPNSHVSLALPGQSASAFTGQFGDDLVGVATGATQTYAFKADRPGTFVYEAGHTPDGARQVAMGLAGALVVLANDGTAYGTTRSGYDDDAVVVLSEIDPSLNANPNTFDMRNFKPEYRLINGKPFPSTDPIGTDQGRTVLLRYVNVGSQTHSMSLLGATETEVAQDGRALTYPATVFTEAVASGATADTLVTMPTGPEARFALFENAHHLDNAAQTTGDPLQLAFGGMLTFLDTNAPAASTDGVGPVSKNISVSPNPSDGLAPVTVTADLSDAKTGGSNVVQAEFVIDDAETTGAGFGTPMNATFGTVDVTGAQGTISTSVLDGLDAGRHSVFVRALDSAGNWGVIGSVILNLPKTGPLTTAGSATPDPANGSGPVAISATGDDTAAGGNITAAEYFIDTVGANGSGTALTTNRTASVVSEDGTIGGSAITALGEGVHHIYVHSKDSLGLWGPPLDITLQVDLTGPTVDAASVGPNPSNGVLSDKGNPGYLVVSAQITDTDQGGARQSKITDAEGFLDPTGTPAGGSGFQLIAVDGKLDSSQETVYGLIPISQIRSLSNGVHHVAVRGQDAAGNWGPLFSTQLTVDKTAPALGTLTATPNPTGGASTVTATATVTDTSLIAAAEYWFGATAPAPGAGSSIPVSVVNGKIVATIPMAGVAAGNQQLNLRVQDLAGNWSAPVSTTLNVQRSNAIFSDGFDSGTLAAWSASVGRLTVIAAAGIPPGGTNKGLQVDLPGGTTATTANRASFVTDNTPAAETTYHLRFQFNRNTLTSGTTAGTILTLARADTATGAQVFALQYRVNAGAPQVRVAMNRSGATPVNGAWYTLRAGAHLMQLDWVSGTATGTPTGSLALLVDGTSRSAATGNTSTLRIERLRLGVVSGFSATSKGTAFFDSVVTQRSPF